MYARAPIRFRRCPDSFAVGDVVYVGPDVRASQTDDTTMIDGVPTLVVEILSPSTTQEELTEKLDDYLAAGVPLVWVVEPKHQTITVYRPDRPPELFNTTHTISADPHLPGFATPVARVFRR